MLVSEVLEDAVFDSDEGLCSVVRVAEFLRSVPLVGKFEELRFICETYRLSLPIRDCPLAEVRVFKG